MGKRMSRAQIVRDYDLEKKTRMYWELSQSARGFGPTLTTGDAIIKANDLMGALNPGRKVWQHVALLQSEIIDHGRCKRPRKKAANVTQLKK